jgi:tripartite-type tricarboxylate transporter receptor subunit TctC
MSDERVVFFFLGGRVFDPKVIGDRVAAGQQSLPIENSIALGPRHGGQPHVTMMQIGRQRGIKWVHVPFKGVADSVNALLGGHINAIADLTGWAPQVNAGQFRLLVTFGPTRTKNWSEVPTLKDTGIEMVVNGPYGIAGPKGMDPKIVKYLHDAFQKGMNESSFTAILAQLDQDPFYMSSEDYRSTP